jgi:MFS family permease
MARRVFDHRDFRYLVLGQVVDTLGNALMPVALAFAVLDLGGTATQLGLVVGSASTGVLLLLLVGGVIADRWSRTTLLLWSNVVAAVAVGVMAVLVLIGSAAISLLMVLAFVAGALSGVAFPAAAALLPETVPAELLQRANAVNSSGRGTTRLVGLVGGAALVAFIGPGWGIAVNAASFAAAALAFSRISARTLSGRDSTIVADLRDGWRTFMERRWVWTVVASFTIMNAAFAGAVVVLGPVIADQTIGRARWGWVMGGEAAGVLVAALALSRVQHRARLVTGMVCTALTTPWMLALGLSPTVGLLVVSAFVAGLGMGYFDVVWHVSLQEHIPGDRLSRVYSIDALGSVGAVPLGQLSAGWLAVSVGTRHTVVLFGIVVGLAALGAVAVPEVRALKPTGP